MGEGQWGRGGLQGAGCAAQPTRSRCRGSRAWGPQGCAQRTPLQQQQDVQPPPLSEPEHSGGSWEGHISGSRHPATPKAAPAAAMDADGSAASSTSSHPQLQVRFACFSG